MATKLKRVKHPKHKGISYLYDLVGKNRFKKRTAGKKYSAYKRVDGKQVEKHFKTIVEAIKWREVKPKSNPAKPNQTLIKSKAPKLGRPKADKFLSLEEVSKLLRISKNTVRANIKDLPHIKVGRQFRFSKNALLESFNKG